MRKSEAKAAKSSPKAVPESETAKARTAGSRSAKARHAVPTPEEKTTRGRTGVTLKKGSTAGKKATSSAAAAKVDAKKPAATAAKIQAKKPAGAAAKAAGKKPAAARAKAAAKKPAGAAAKAGAKKPAAAAAKAAAQKPAGAAAKAGAKKPAAAPAKAAAKTPAATAKSAATKPAAAKAKRTPSEPPLAPEAMPRIRRTVHKPAPGTVRPQRAPRDRSQIRGAGLRELEWPQMALAARNLASTIGRTWTPEVVVGVAKGGVFAGQEVASALHVPFFPVRVGKRSRDVGHRAPEAAASMPAEAAGKRVLVVDDIAGSGATLRSAIAAAQEAGAAEVRTATLVVRAGGYLPDFFGVETADLVVFPWDYEATTGAVGSASGDTEEEEGLPGPAPYDFDEGEDDLDTFGV